MSIVTITDSSPQLNWSQLPKRVQHNKESNNTKETDTLSYVSDFISTKDEITKPQSSKTDTAKGIRPFSYTSENWIG